MGQGQYIEIVHIKKAGNKQRGSGRGKWRSCRGTARRAGEVHRDCLEKKDRGHAERQWKG